MSKEVPILYSFRRCPYAIRARWALLSSNIDVELREVVLKDKPSEFLSISTSGTVPCLQLKEKIIVPQVGQDNNKILKSIGYTRKRIDILKKKNVV